MQSCFFQLGWESFHKVFILVDGIYPLYPRFVKAEKDPLNHEDKRQEYARKDIECVFGLLQEVSQFTYNVIVGKKWKIYLYRLIHDLFIMLVSNHVKGNPRKRYDPVYNVNVDNVLVFRN